MPFTPYHAAPRAPMPPNTQWQSQPGRMPSPAYLASGMIEPQPALGKARAVSAEPVAPLKFVLPSPQALGVSTSLNVPAAPVAAPVDWNQIQARIERLRVLEYKKVSVGDQVCVRLVLPTADPTMGQPVTAQAATEAAAILLALDHAEAFVAKR